jgi:Beta-ketoacyl synthase, N-terminal domain
MTRVYLQGIGLCGPGLDGWERSQPMLAGEASYVPAPPSIPPSALLPPNERRRTVRTVKLALAVGAEAFEHARVAPGAAATVFASSGGDGDTLDEILKGLSLPDREVSPTRFHNSVHNAPAGYWSIATLSREPSSSLCAHDGSFAAGLVDAAAQAVVDDRMVGLVAYDLPYPEPLHRARPIGAIFATALVLTPRPSELSLAELDVAIERGRGQATRLAEPLEALRAGTPAARGLPLLAALARSAAETVILDYIDACALRVAVAPRPRGIAAATRRIAPALAPS